MMDAQRPAWMDQADGDETLIAWMLSLTPTERLDVLTDAANALLELRRDFEAR